MLSFDVNDALTARLVLAVSAASLGAGLAASFKKISHLGLCLLISFAAGSLLAVSCLDIIPETVELVGPWAAAGSLATGYLFFFLITRFVYHVCPACSATHTEVKFKALTWSMLLALAVHSFMDGLAVYGGTMTEETSGRMVLLAVAFHKFPEGLALTLVALGSGMGRLKAFLVCFLMEAVTTVAGGMTGVWLGVSDHAAWMGFVLGHVGGGFLFLAYHALLSDFVKHHPKHTIFAAAFGAACIGAIQLLFGHGH